jgi:acyl carrier protein
MRMEGNLAAVMYDPAFQEEKLTVQERVRQFIVENFYVTDPSDLADDVSLINSGLVDSTGMLEVIAFLEAEFGIRIGDQETIPSNLETVGRITAFVERKRSTAA